MKFEIYYSASGLFKGEIPLPDDRIEHHMSCLESDLMRIPDLQAVQLEMQTRLDGESSVAQVAAISAHGEQETLKRVADGLRVINMRTPGLCFLIRKE